MIRRKMVPAAGLVLAAFAANSVAMLQQEYKSGVVWPEPKIVSPGEKSSDPPADAIVLFDGKDLSKWKNGDKWELKDGYAVVQKSDIVTTDSYGDYQLHVEFATPEKVRGSGQGRGNSGVYLQGRYEVQMLDSFGLDGKDNECGGVYSVGAPKINMCYPPLSWQTYDIDYTAAKYNASGKLTANPRMTVRHNGVVIHDNLELPGERNTTAAPVKAGPEPGPVYLQDHGNPVRYRNIWVVPTDS